MRVFQIGPSGATELDAAPAQASAGAMVWLACSHQEFADRLAEIQATLHRLCGMQLVELHVSDLLNQQLPSSYDYTAQYDLLVFHRLAASHILPDAPPGVPVGAGKRSGPPILRRIDTRPVGFAVFDHVLLTVHPPGCAVHATFAARLLATASAEPGAYAGTRMPASAPDLMLRIVSLMVDGDLDLRRELTRQLDH